MNKRVKQNAVVANIACLKNKTGINNKASIGASSLNFAYGITLITLVITIILLIILAGVTINLTVGENGLLNTSKKAVEEQKRAAVYEKVSMMLAEYMPEKYTDNTKLIDYLNEQKSLGKIQNVTDNSNGTYTILVDGYDLTIKESDLSIIEISKSGPTPQISDILVTLEDGVTVPEDYSVEIGTKLKINFSASIIKGEIKSIEPNLPYITDGTELEKEFTIVGDLNGKECTKTIIVSLKDKYKLKNPEIVLSNSEWTKNNIQVTVNWFNDNEKLKKEISLDGGKTYQKYVGPIEISKNCVIKAKISNEIKEAIGEMPVEKIDKLEPNMFTPTVSDLVSSTELQINANATDAEATEEYGKSGIQGYIYYVYKGGDLIVKSDLINSASWTASGLVVGETYDIYVEAYDNAKNVTKSETISYTKLEVYVWARYEANKSETYSYSSNDTILTSSNGGNNCEFVKGGSISDYFDKNTGYFILKNSESVQFKYLETGCWFVDYVSANYYQLYYAKNDAEERNGYTGDKWQINVIAYKRNVNTTYQKVDNLLQYVTSNNSSAYPDCGGQGDYWYEKVN